MSRWLKSVNNLLETLDGQAENVADGDYIIDDAIGNLLEKATGAGLRQQGSAEYYSTDDDEGDEDYYDEEGASADDDEIILDDEGNEYYEEEVTSSNPSNQGEIISSTEDGGSPTGRKHDGNDGVRKEAQEQEDEEDAISIGIPAQKKRLNSTGNVVDDDAVSEISFSESYIEEELVEEGNAPGEVPLNEADVPPKTPSRQISDQGSMTIEMTTTSTNPTKPSPENFTHGNRHSVASGQESKQSQNSHSRSESMDCSPRPPRRSIENVHAPIPAPVSDIWGNTETSGESANPSTEVDSAPPKIPTRQASHTKASPATEPADLGVETSKRLEGANNIPRAPTSASIPAKATPKAPDNSQEVKNLTMKMQSLQVQLRKAKNDLKSSQSKASQLEKNAKALTTKLETAEAEINAQREELLRAGERMEKDRARFQEERDDMLDEHDDEIDQLKEIHESEISAQKSQFEKQIKDLRQQLRLEESRRKQEGGDWTKELEDAIQREKDALLQLNQVQSEKNVIQSTASKLEMQQSALQTKLDATLASAKTAAERERQAEDKLDAALSLHARQMSQRQTREAELERTIFELGSALMVARQKEGQAANIVQASDQPKEEEANFKDLYEQANEELETIKVQFNMETQRREALQHELNEISKERTEEATSAQAKQRQHDRKVADLESSISRLKHTVRELKNSNSSLVKPSSEGQAPELLRQLNEAKLEIGKLSEQLLRQQDRADVAKSEILALKGRLEAATTRANEAENALYAQTPSQSTSTGRMYEMEGGGVGYSNPTTRRRVKGGGFRARGGGSSVRSIRSALQFTAGRTTPAMEPVLATIDALDSWMVETGAFLRHEPLARLAFVVYLLTLHLWSFALVVFHTTEQPHADFGSMGNNPRNWRPHT